jgi:hypothetical protein
MDGAVDERGRSAAPEELVEEELGDFRAMRRVGELLLLEESVVVQPVQGCAP